MALPGETGYTNQDTCPDCKTQLILGVMWSFAGWYIGTSCNCGPCFSRETSYFKTEKAAQKAFDNGSWETVYHR